MLTQIIKHLQSKLATLPYLEEINGLAKIIYKETTQFPAFHINGEAQPLNIDTKRTQVFFLLDGAISRENTEDTLIGCADKVTETYPIMIVLLETEDKSANHSQMIAWGISQTLSGKQPELMAETNKDYVFIKTTNINVDRKELWKALYGSNWQSFQHIKIAGIRIEIQTTGNENCYTPYTC